MDSVSSRKIIASKGWLTLEFIALYLAVPATLSTLMRTYSPLPFLAAFSLIAVIYLLWSADFVTHRFYQIRAIRRHLPRILSIFLILGTSLFLFVWWKCPQYLFYCPRNHPRVWLSILWSYPLLAVYPQERTDTILYKSLFLS
jgi:hypothetical protein